MTKYIYELWHQLEIFYDTKIATSLGLSKNLASTFIFEKAMNSAASTNLDEFGSIASNSFQSFSQNSFEEKDGISSVKQLNRPLKLYCVKSWTSDKLDEFVLGNFFQWDEVLPLDNTKIPPEGYIVYKGRVLRNFNINTDLCFVNQKFINWGLIDFQKINLAHVKWENVDWNNILQHSRFFNFENDLKTHFLNIYSKRNLDPSEYNPQILSVDFSTRNFRHNGVKYSKNTPTLTLLTDQNPTWYIINSCRPRQGIASFYVSPLPASLLQRWSAQELTGLDVSSIPEDLVDSSGCRIKETLNFFKFHDYYYKIVPGSGKSLDELVKFNQTNNNVKDNLNHIIRYNDTHHCIKYNTKTSKFLPLVEHYSGRPFQKNYEIKDSVKPVKLLTMLGLKNVPPHSNELYTQDVNSVLNTQAMIQSDLNTVNIINLEKALSCEQQALDIIENLGLNDKDSKHFIKPIQNIKPSPNPWPVP